MLGDIFKLRERPVRFIIPLIFGNIYEELGEMPTPMVKSYEIGKIRSQGPKFLMDMDKVQRLNGDGSITYKN